MVADRRVFPEKIEWPVGDAAQPVGSLKEVNARNLAADVNRGSSQPEVGWSRDSALSDRLNQRCFGHLKVQLNVALSAIEAIHHNVVSYDREIQLHLRFIMRCLTASGLVSVLRAQWPGLSDVQAARCLHLGKFSRCKLYFNEWHTICAIINLAYSVP